MKCMHCNNSGLILVTRRKYPVNHYMLASPSVYTATACHMCKRGKIIKRFKLLDEAKQYDPTHATLKHKNEIAKLIKTMQTMEMENGSMREVRRLRRSTG